MDSCQQTQVACHGLLGFVQGNETFFNIKLNFINLSTAITDYFCMIDLKSCSPGNNQSILNLAETAFNVICSLLDNRIGENFFSRGVFDQLTL